MARRNGLGAILIIGAMVLLVRAAVAETIIVTVHEMDGGKPIANASVEVNPEEGEAFTRKTGNDGTLSVDLPAGAEDGFEVSVSSDGFAPLIDYWYRSQKKPRPERIDFQMEKGVTIGGIVVDEHGHPIAGAWVCLWARKKYPNSEQHLNVAFKGITTGADGRWTFNGFPEKFDEFELGAYDYHHLGQEAFYELKKVDDVSSLRDRSYKTVLTTGTPLTITITDQAGKPLAGAKVGYGQDRIASNIIPAAKADAKGKVELGVQPGNTAILTVMSSGCAPQQQRISIGQAPVAVYFTMDAAVPLTGKVVDASGNPLKDASVCFDTWRGTRPFDKRVQTAADGTFSWAEAPSDDVFVDIFKMGYGDQRGVRMKVGEPNVVKLPSPTTFSGTVLDAETGKPVEHFHVILGIDFKQGGGVGWDREGDEGGDAKGGVFERTFTYPYPARVLRVEADGYLPADSDPVPFDGASHSFVYHLVKGKPVAGIVSDSAGKPVAGAQVVLVTGSNGVQVQNGEVPEWEGRSTPMTKTGSDGRFTFPAQKDQYGILVLSKQGYAQVSQEDLKKVDAITLTPWAEIEGEVRVGTKPGGQQQVTINYWRSGPVDNASPFNHLFKEGSATADANGHFVLAHVFAENGSVGRAVHTGPNQISYAQTVQVLPKPGETLHVQIGGHGRPIVGHAEIPDSIKKQGYVVGFSTLSLKVDEVKWSPPAEVMAMTIEQSQRWYADWLKSDEGQRITKAREEAAAKRKNYPLTLDTDGRFSAEDIPAGTYDVQISLMSLPSNGSTCPGGGEPIASGGGTITVPEIPGGVSDDPLDVGIIAMQEIKSVKVGDVAPEFVTKTLGGKDLKLSDFRGKYLLLDFWATWCGPCVAETPSLKEAWAAGGANPRFAMLSLSLDTDVKAPAAFVKAHDIQWNQGFLGEWSKDTVTKAYGIQGIPSIWLIDPQGKVIAKDLRGSAIAQAVTSALSQGH